MKQTKKKAVNKAKRKTVAKTGTRAGNGTASKTKGAGPVKATNKAKPKTTAPEPHKAQPQPISKVTLEVGPSNRAGSRLIIARRGETEIHRDQQNTNKSSARQKVIARIAKVCGSTEDSLKYLDAELIDKADKADADLQAELTDQAGTGDDAGQGKKSQATLIVELASTLELCHTPDDEAFAVVEIADHFETWPVKGRSIKAWLRKRYHEEYRTVPGSQAVQDALSVLEGQAIFNGLEEPLCTRIAGKGKAIFVDMGDRDWQAVKITAKGWKIVSRPSVRFQRPPRMLPLPIPVQGGSLDELWQFVNVREEDRPLVLGWLVQALSPTGPYPPLCLYGQQGSAKSTTAKALRALVDPSGAPLRAEPKDVRDLAIAAKSNWVLAFDNLSYITHELSDALCRLSTGGGFATRQLFSDADEVIFDFQRPVILNGIEELATRADLLERSIILDLPPINEDDRKTEKKFWIAFSSALPRILGSLFNAVVTALKKLPSTELPTKPRMADFAIWAHASESSWGSASGKFLHAYQANQDAAQKLPLESSPITEPLFKFLAKLKAKEWTGTATGLLEELEKPLEDSVKRKKTWPANPQVLSNHLRRLLPNLKTEGVLIDFNHSGKRLICIKTTKKSVATTKKTAEPSLSSSKFQNVIPGSPEEYEDLDDDVDDLDNDDLDDDSNDDDYPVDDGSDDQNPRYYDPGDHDPADYCGDTVCDGPDSDAWTWNRRASQRTKRSTTMDCAVTP